MLRPLVEIGDGARAAGEFLGDGGDVLLGDVAVITVEGLTGDLFGVGGEEQLNGAGDVVGVNFLAAGGRCNRLAAQHPADQVVPPAFGGWMVQAINASWPQRADRPAFAEAVTMDEFLERG